MIPEEPVTTDQLRRSPTSASHVELSEQDCLCPSPMDKSVATECPQVNCSCCCQSQARVSDADRLRRLVPVRAGIRRRRGRRGSVLPVHTRRLMPTRTTRIVPEDDEDGPAVPGDSKVSGRCSAVDLSTSHTLSDGCAADPVAQLASSVTRCSSNILLPFDPRTWTRDDVHSWLRLVSMQFNIPDDIDAGRFPMNGKALCLMNTSMFLYRVPRGGDLLYQDFQHRLVRAALMSH